MIVHVLSCHTKSLTSDVFYTDGTFQSDLATFLNSSSPIQVSFGQVILTRTAQGHKALRPRLSGAAGCSCLKEHATAFRTERPQASNFVSFV